MPRFSPSFGLFSTLLLLMGLVGCAHQTQSTRPFAPQPFAHEGSDLKPDPAIRWGRLPNGLRYAILPHAMPRQRVSVYLTVEAGSLHESNSERGYAHFVEHMAFRDLRGVSAGVFATLEKLGASPHSSAHTTPLHTTYFFNELPTTDRETVAQAFALLRAIADGIVFTPEGVVRERGVILSEIRARSDDIGGSARVRDDALEFAPPRETVPKWQEIEVLLANTRLAQRHPMGSEESLQGATAARLRSFYDRWYRPERMILTVVGDADSAEIERTIEATFAPLAARGRPPREPVLAAPDNSGRLSINLDPIDPSISIAMGVARATPPRDDRSARERTLAQRLSLEMLERRLEKLERTDPAPLLSSSAFVSHLVPTRELVLVRSNARPETWREAMLAIDYEVRRILERGFTPVELQAAAREERLRLAAAARQAGLRHSGELASTLAASIRHGVVFTAVSDDRQLAEEQLARIDPQRCHAAFREMLQSGEWSMLCSGPVPRPPGDKFNITFQESRTAELKAYEPPAPPAPFPYTDFGPAGVVVKNERFEAIDTQMVQFANGVRLNLKRTDFEPGRIRVDLRLLGGLATTGSNGAIAGWRANAWPAGGLQGMTPEAERAALFELNNGSGFSAKPGSLSLTGSNEAVHMPLMFQMAAAYLTRPAFRAYSVARADEGIHNALLQANGSARGVASWQLLSRITSGHPAFRVPRVEDLRTHTFADFKAWLLPQLASAPIEIGVIGDFDPSTAIDTVARTVGALPARASFESLAPLKEVAFPPKPFSETIPFKSSSNLAVIMMAWPVLEPSRYPAQFHAHFAVKILEQRLWQKLRQEMGESYVIGAQLFTEEALSPHVVFIQCLIDAAPDRTEAIAAAAREIATNLREHGATIDELERARQPLLRGTETALRDNSWWLDVVTFAQSDPAYAQGWLGAQAAYEAATLDQINTALRRWLDPGRRYEIIAKPEK